ncbi:MAG: hypothetical protein CMF94_05085 [Candidatus Marinimicrobia bacterium]|nr:hypothetical protein [Candidatus Neomarinimicrobiota bacterium]|tara:strand:- start:2559 stop:3248 length:690 start_codon:yes stop_codon:yes gene_type:complete
MNYISIIMSTFNSEQHVGKSIDSILNQTFEDFEFLILDDGSTDNTQEVVKNYSKSDKRIKFYKNDVNLGLTLSLNTLIQNASGNIIARQDSDDISRKNRIEMQINFLKENNLDACTSFAVSQQTLKKINNLKSYLPLNLVIKYRNPFIHGSLILKKKVLNEIGNYDERFKYAQDYKLMTDLIKSNYKVKILKEVLYELNTENNISTNKKNEQAYYANCVRRSIDPLLKN